MVKRMCFVLGLAERVDKVLSGGPTAEVFFLWSLFVAQLFLNGTWVDECSIMTACRPSANGQNLSFTLVCPSLCPFPQIADFASQPWFHPQHCPCHICHEERRISTLFFNPFAVTRGREEEEEWTSTCL